MYSFVCALLSLCGVFFDYHLFWGGIGSGFNFQYSLFLVLTIHHIIISQSLVFTIIHYIFFIYFLLFYLFYYFFHIFFSSFSHSLSSLLLSLSSSHLHYSIHRLTFVVWHSKWHLLSNWSTYLLTFVHMHFISSLLLHCDVCLHNSLIIVLHFILHPLGTPCFISPSIHFFTHTLHHIHLYFAFSAQEDTSLG